VLRNGRGESVAFISPWSLIFFAMVVIYLLTWLYESRKVSDNEAAPDDKELKKMNLAVMATGLSVVLLSGAFLSAGDRIEGTVKWFLGGFEVLLLVILGFLLGRMYLRRKKAQV
jgi:cbb3-type cytochrome oxidase subunit 3